MATTDNQKSDSEAVYVITLVCRPHGSDISPIPKRQFILSKERSSIRIGRASKVPTKGFVASIDNAWFDSPVMSRHHAELYLGFDDDNIPKAVFIKDVGSLHGTFHTPHDGVGKETRLEQGKFAELSNGDSLRFGTNIFRSKETFPPCSVEFYMIEQEHEPRSQVTPTIGHPTNRVFTIPDDDIDDEDDDDDSVVETIVPLSRKVDSQRVPSIDLTQDEADPAEDRNTSTSAAHNSRSSDVIDLTSEPDEQPNMDLPIAIPIPPSASLAAAVPIIPALVAAFTARGLNLPAGLDYPQQPTTFDGETDGPPDHESDYPYRQTEGSDSDDIRLTDSESDSVVFGNVVDSLSLDEDFDDEESLTSDFNDDFSRNGDWGGDDESLDDLPYSDDVSSQSSEEMTDPVSRSSSPRRDSSPHSSPNLPVSEEPASKDALPESSSTEPSFVTPFLFTSTLQGVQVAQQRAPSPSDAAMFKSHPILDQSPSHARAQALGEMSGKFEYFAARESNRMNRGDWVSPPPHSVIRDTSSESPDQHVTGAEVDHDTHPAPPTVQVDESQSNHPEEEVIAIDTVSITTSRCATASPANKDYTAVTPWQPWSASGERFINNPRHEDLPGPCSERQQSLELDMTSAYTFQLSKLACENGTAQRPRRVEIQDLLTQEPNGMQTNTPADQLPTTATPIEVSTPRPIEKLSPEPSLKRSFEEAFNDGDSMIEQGEAQSHPCSSRSRSEPACGQAQDMLMGDGESGGDAVNDTPSRKNEGVAPPVVVPTRPDNVQPSKKRRFAQAAAYVAFGGAAAFTFLVSTAPAL